MDVGQLLSATVFNDVCGADVLDRPRRREAAIWHGTKSRNVRFGSTRDRAIKVINIEQTAAYQGAHVALALGRGLPCLVHF
jgi:hypothetical protein